MEEIDEASVLQMKNFSGRFKGERTLESFPNLETKVKLTSFACLSLCFMVSASVIDGKYVIPYKDIWLLCTYNN